MKENIDIVMKEQVVQSECEGDLVVHDADEVSEVAADGECNVEHSKIRCMIEGVERL